MQTKYEWKSRKKFFFFFVAPQVPTYSNLPACKMLNSQLHLLLITCGSLAIFSVGQEGEGSIFNAIQAIQDTPPPPTSTPTGASYTYTDYSSQEPSPLPQSPPSPIIIESPSSYETIVGEIVQEIEQGVQNPFQPVQGYPSELQGIWTADPVLFQYSNPDDSRILQFGTTQCDIYMVTNLGVAVYDYSPVARCDELGELTTRLFLKQIEGDVAAGTEYTIYYALLSVSCTGDQQGQLIEVSSQGSYQCLVYKRDGSLLYVVYGYVYPSFEEVQCPSSWDVDVATDDFADSSIVYSAFETGVYTAELATCIG
eukprot:TRINITY_DN2603_c0_g1_i4.p2 TRINITY_DN2603_c0_g1~~TRINITY_DN2603_c0_g1_i4.p2  ORF type:complete len:320 (-),score=25.29 TRINITY_DN2603_c0_g1_i4:737-1669(-)